MRARQREAAARQQEGPVDEAPGEDQNPRERPNAVVLEGLLLFWMEWTEDKKGLEPVTSKHKHVPACS